jgi:SAM-dependent methyltransferase
MPENVNQCPLCSSTSSDPFDQRIFRGSRVQNHICGKCGLVYQTPRMTEEEMVLYYQADYRRTYQGKEGPVASDLTVQTARAQSLLEFIRPHICTLDRSLDIGCSAGQTLQLFNDHFGSTPVGIEPGDAYREYTRNTGITVYSSLDELQKTGEKKFNLICMSHVLEHLPHPVEYLGHIGETLIEPGGWLLVEVPNLFAHDSFETAHLVSYSPHTLRQTLEKAGFDVVCLETHGRPRSDILPLYITALAHPVFDTPQPWHPTLERWVALRRQMGLVRRRILERLVPLRAWKTL